MKKNIFLVALMLLGQSAQADSLNCSLQSGRGAEKKVNEVNVQLNNSEDEEVEASSKGQFYDLSFSLQASCDEEKDCGVTLTLDSGKLEDEFTQFGFSFQKNEVSSEVFSQRLTSKRTPDKRSYKIKCIYSP